MSNVHTATTNYAGYTFCMSQLRDAVYNWKKDVVQEERLQGPHLLYPDDWRGMEAQTTPPTPPHPWDIANLVIQLMVPDIESNPPGEH